MKIDDIAKQLANKVNQEHYIKHYLEKVQRGAYNKGVKDSEAKQLTLTDVSQHRELLIAFQENFYEGIHDVTRKHIELGVDKYLSNL
jgi:DNA-binding GntR family transcriptional regulator